MKRKNEVLVGFVVALAVILGVLGTLWLVRGGLTSGYPLYARFPWGSGLKQGQPVLLSGVNVGYVGDINLEKDGTLTVTMRIMKDYDVPSGTVATVEPNGLFGDMEIALRANGPSPVRYAPGDTVPAGKPSVTMGELLARLDTVSRGVRSMSDAFTVELVQNRGIADLRETTTHMNSLLAKLDNGQGTAGKLLSDTLLYQDLRNVVGRVDSLTADFKRNPKKYINLRVF